MTVTMNRRLVSLLALALGAVFLSAPAAGASCAPPIPLEEAMEQAPVVFVGTVTKVEHDGRLATFTVGEVWKGDVEARVLVSGGPTPSDLDGLGFGESVVTSVDRNFEEGATYLVVPFGTEKGVYMDNSCSATQVYDSNLDEFRPANAYTPVDPGPDGDVMIARIAVGVVVLVAGGAVAVSVMRRRASVSLFRAGFPSGGLHG